jgi:hypothetical protein
MPIITYICRRKGNIYYLKPGKPILKKQDTTILQYLKRNMKSESAKNILKTLLSLVLGLLIIWAMYRNSDLGELWDIIETANFGIIGVSLIFGLIGNILRGLRWELFVNSLGYHPPRASLINATLGNYAVNFLLPRAGDFDADMIENMTQKVTQLSNSISLRDADEELLSEIKNLQEKTMLLRENIIDKQRVISSMLRSEFIATELQPKLTIIIKDINSLIEHIKFSFDRLDYLQDAFLGYVNIEQNKIIKIFTIVSVIFMPPTLIASIYGMNFDFMPELDKKWGYPVALILMVLSSLIILYIFRKKKWL